MRPGKPRLAGLPEGFRAFPGELGMGEQGRKPGEKKPRVDPDDRVLRGIIRMFPVALVFWALLALLVHWLS